MSHLSSSIDTGSAPASVDRQGATPDTTARPSTFFENDELLSVLHRGLFYAKSGVPIHFTGTPGRGKTALAMEIARRLGRPITVITGNDWLSAEDLVGRQVGQSSTTLVDKYVQHVRRTEKTTRHDWGNSPLAQAMLNGNTLVYDEFTRSNAKANSILLSVLEEGILVSTDPLAPTDVISAHPDFRVILTSNPQDYEGVNSSPDALLDRIVTFRMPRFSAETECGIVASKTGIALSLSQRIVQLVHKVTATKSDESDTNGPSMRAAILIARIAERRVRENPLSHALLAQITADVMNGRGCDVTAADVARHLTSDPMKETTT